MQNAKSITKVELAQTIHDAMQRAFALVPATDAYGYAERVRIAQANGIDANIAALGMFDLSYRVQKQLAFGLGVDFQFDVEVRNARTLRSKGVRCETKVSWSSGGGTPAEAVAISTLHLEMAQKAAQLEMSFNDALRHIRIDDDADVEAFLMALEEFFSTHVKPAHEACRDAWKRAHGE